MTLSVDPSALFEPDQSKPIAGAPQEPYPWLLIDGGGLATTAWSTHKGLERPEDRVKATVYVFVTVLASLSRMVDPQAKIIVAWDGRDNRAWRRGHHPWYKHGRGTVINREEVRAAINGIDELIRCIGGATIQVDGREADDVVATLATRIENDKKETCLIFSDDRDYVQLISTGVHLCRRSLQGIVLSPEQCELMGVPYGLDYLLIKALQGDPGDNIRGLPGIGEVKAIELMEKIPDLVDTARVGPEDIDWSGLDKKTYNAMVRAGRKLLHPPVMQDENFAMRFAVTHDLARPSDHDLDETDCLNAAAKEAVRMFDLVELDTKMDLPKFGFPKAPSIERIPAILQRLELQSETDLLSSLYSLARMRNPDAIPPRTATARAGAAVRS